MATRKKNQKFAVIRSDDGEELYAIDPLFDNKKDALAGIKKEIRNDRIDGMHYTYYIAHLVQMVTEKTEDIPVAIEDLG